MKQQSRWQLEQPQSRWQLETSERRQRVNEAYPQAEGRDLGRMNDAELANAGIPAPPSFGTQGASFGAMDNIFSGVDAAGAALNTIFQGGRGVPQPSSPGQAASDTFRNTLDARQEIMDARREARPVTSTLSEIGGGLPAGGVTTRAMAAARPAVSGALQRAGRFVGDVAKSAGLGAVAAGAYGFNEADDLGEDRLAAAADASVYGGAWGAAVPVALGALGRSVGRNADVPDVDDLQRLSERAYDAVDEMGVAYRPEAVVRAAQNARDAAAREGLDPVLNTRVQRVLDRFVDDAADRTTPLSVGDVDRFRQRIGKTAIRPAARAGDDDSVRLGMIARDEIDDFMVNTSPDDVVSGSSSDAVRALGQARQAHATFRKSEALEEAIQQAQTLTNNSNSGANFENNVRKSLTRLLNSPKTANAFNEAERAAIRSIIDGNASQNTLRWIGSLAPSRGGLMTWINAVGFSVDPASAAASLGAEAAKRAADGGVRRNLAGLTRLVRTGENAPRRGLFGARVPAGVSASAGVGSESARSIPSNAAMWQMPQLSRRQQYTQ